MQPIVVKLGSSVVADAEGRVRSEVISSVASDVTALIAAGTEVVLVSSGAIARGVDALGLSERPKAVDELQAASAVGQAAMFRAWEVELARHGMVAAQVLLTLHDIEDRSSNLSIKATLRRLLSWGVVPVINENDTTTTEEITFGDNDLLAAQVAIMLDAGLVVLLTDAEGLHESDPREDPDSPVITEVSSFDRIASVAIGQRPGEHGSGGMRSKVVAAEMATSAGIETVVAPGARPGAVRMAAGRESIGTRFLASAERHNSFKGWLRYAKATEGRIEVDEGAARALREQGTSLLPVGVIGVEGQFEAGDAVEVVHADAVIGKGLVSFSAEELRLVAGMKTAAVRDLLPRAAEEAVHRDRFVLA